MSTTTYSPPAPGAGAPLDPALVAARLARMSATLDERWRAIIAESPMLRAIVAGDFDVRLYAIYLVATYHYTLHNARNQALVGVRAIDAPPNYVKFCFEHAAEETGHELMALHDLRRLGLGEGELVLPEPLPAVDVLTGYLYWVAVQGNPLQRLGYSYWAESVYSYIGPVLGALRTKLRLTDADMTFFVAHSSIDEHHAAEVTDMIARFARSEADLDAIERVMTTSLALTARMLDDVHAEYLRLVRGEPSAYAFLDALVS